VVSCDLVCTAEVMQSGQNFQIIPNLMLKDSEEQTILSVALWNKLYDIVVQLIAGGASVNGSNSKGLTLLHEAILAGDETSALFLLNQQADVNTR
jgi:ankyrin repeat protein